MSKSDLPRLSVAELAEDNGVHRNAVYTWLRNNNFDKKPYTLKLGGRLRVRLDVAEKYAANRAARRPRGWTSRKALASDLQLNPCGKLMVRLLKGARVQRYKNNLYIHPDDAKLAAVRLKELRAPPSYLPVAALVKHLGRGRSVIYGWAKRHQVRLPFYLSKKVERHMHIDDATRYEQVVRDTP